MEVGLEVLVTEMVIFSFWNRYLVFFFYRIKFIFRSSNARLDCLPKKVWIRNSLFSM